MHIVLFFQLILKPEVRVVMNMKDNPKNQTGNNESVQCVMSVSANIETNARESQSTSVYVLSRKCGGP